MKKKPKPPLVRLSSSRAPSASTLRILAKGADEYMVRLGTGELSAAQIARRLEQFFTVGPVAIEMLDLLEIHFPLANYFIVEPSAGDGKFTDLLPVGSMSLDVASRSAGIIKANFFDVTIDHKGLIAVIGNPPFSLAVPFFNHAASQAHLIAMILPKSFNKESVLRRLDRRFHLVAQVEVPPYAFLRNGKRCNVRAVFQIWVKRETERAISVPVTSHPDFTFTKREGAHFVIQRVGTAAGLIHHDFDKSDQSHLFVTVTEPMRAKHVEAVLRSLPLAAVAENTAGNPSIAAFEIFALYCKELARASWCWHVPTAEWPAPRRSRCPQAKPGSSRRATPMVLDRSARTVGHVGIDGYRHSIATSVCLPSRVRGAQSAACASRFDEP